MSVETGASDTKPPGGSVTAVSVRVNCGVLDSAREESTSDKTVRLSTKLPEEMELETCLVAVDMSSVLKDGVRVDSVVVSSECEETDTKLGKVLTLENSLVLSVDCWFCPAQELLCTMSLAAPKCASLVPGPEDPLVDVS